MDAAEEAAFRRWVRPILDAVASPGSRADAEGMLPGAADVREFAEELDAAVEKVDPTPGRTPEQKERVIRLLQNMFVGFKETR